MRIDELIFVFNVDSYVELIFLLVYFNVFVNYCFIGFIFKVFKGFMVCENNLRVFGEIIYLVLGLLYFCFSYL